MSIEKRIEKLEEQAGACEQVVVTVCYEGDDTEPTEAQREAAIADFKAKHPDRGNLIVLFWEKGQFEKS